MSDITLKLLAMYDHRGDGMPTQYVNPDGPEAVEAILALRARVEAKNDADLNRHIFAWFNDIDCDEMRRCLEAYDARQAIKDTPVE